MDKKISISEQVKQLIAGQLSGSLSAEERHLLKSWMDESSDHKGHFNEMRYAWALSDKEISSREQGASIWKLSDKIQRYRRQNHTLWTWQKIAASWLIIFIGSGVLGWNLKKSDSEETKIADSVVTTTTVQAKMGSQSMVDMPDGTRVWLNGGSKLAYGSTYGEHDREVQLIGEGCFEVVTNPEKPFVVKAGNLAIKAFGTTFNVKAYPEDNTITTTLVKGKVTIVGKDENDITFSYEMQPNENFTYMTEYKTKKESPPAPIQNQTSTSVALNILPEPVVIENNIKTELYTSWKDDLWVIDKQELGALTKDFERRYNVRIDFSSESIAGYQFSGTIQRETIEQVMRILRRTIPLKYSFDKNIITIGEDPVLMKEFQLKNKVAP